MSVRISAGDQKGRLLRTPRRAATRPSSAKLRAALFNILGSRIAGARWLDLFAGSGVIGLEALCRGAAAATFVDEHPEACRCIEDNIRMLGCGDRAVVRCLPVRRFLASGAAAEAACDLVFADPPYGDSARADQLDDLLRLCEQSAMITPRAWLLIEHAARTTPPTRGGRWRAIRTYTYGDSALTLYQPDQPIQS